MQQLAIETSSRQGSVALFEGNVCRQEYLLSPTERTTQTLTLALDRLIKLSRSHEPLQTIGLISVVSGPGSFTGLRIGVTTAKTLAYAWGVPLIAVSSLEVIAHQGLGELSGVLANEGDRQIAVAIDAYRGDMFGAIWSSEHGKLTKLVQPPAPFSRESWNLRLEEPDIDWDRLILVGDGFRDWKMNRQRDCKLGEQGCWQPRASTLGKIAYERFLLGQRENLWTLEPNYLRVSTAEEKCG